MRTTLTIDDDVAAQLKRLAGPRGFKAVTTRALRLGLRAMQEQETAPSTCEIQPVYGRPRVGNLDNIAEVLAEAEGEHWRRARW